jgi:ABC-2 type transport system ATP-binding protein
MDEPTIGLDPHQILIVRDLIASLRGRMTVLISSHILPEIEMTCDRVLIINQGRIVAQGTPAELRREVLGQSAYEIEAAGDLGSLSFLLGSIDPGLSIASEGAPDPQGFRTIKLKTLNAEDSGEAILRACLSEGMRVRALSRAHPTLEDVFLAATRRSWDAVTEGPTHSGRS